MNRHCYGCQTQHPPGHEACSLMPKLAEIGWGSCKVEHQNKSGRLAGACPALTSSPWLQALLTGKLSSSAQGPGSSGL